MAAKDVREIKPFALQICQEFLAEEWKNISIDEFKVSEVSGGLSNSLYLCSLPDGIDVKNSKTPRDVLLRIYGKFKNADSETHTESVLQDAIVYTLLAERNLGPQLYGVFGNGRLEEYIPSIILSSDNMRNMSLYTAREMAKIHALQVPIRKIPDTFFKHSEQWLECFEKNIVGYEEKLRPSVKRVLHSKMLWQELEWLNELVHRADSPVVFCHNDLQGGNILLHKEPGTTKLVFIDFEFAFYNYRGFDIANHFNEWCYDYNTEHEPHFVYDWDKFPTLNEQEAFIDVYLEQLVKENALPKNVSREEEKIKILKEIEIFRMFSNIYWCIWSFKMALSAKDRFNFCFEAHGEVRLEMYKMFKKQFLENVLHKNV